MELPYIIEFSLYFSPAPLTAPFKEGRPNPRQILSLAQEVKNWKQLGRALRLKDPQLGEIDEDIKGLFEKSHAMLRRWMEAKGSAATYRELARGLEIVGRRDLIRDFCCERKRCKLPYCLLSVSRINDGQRYFESAGRWT